jgi:hypothetical protein
MIIEEDLVLDPIDMAGFFLYGDRLVIEFGGDPEDPKNIILELRNEEEGAILANVLDDRNFWVQIVNALSAALTEKA